MSSSVALEGSQSEEVEFNLAKLHEVQEGELRDLLYFLREVQAGDPPLKVLWHLEMKLRFPLSNPDIVWLADRWPRPRTVVAKEKHSYYAWSESPSIAEATVGAMAEHAGTAGFHIAAADPMHEDAIRRCAVMDREFPCGIYVLSSKAAAALPEAPAFFRPEMSLGVLTPEDAQVVDDNWKFRREGTRALMRHYIESGLPTACVRVHSNDKKTPERDMTSDEGREGASGEDKSGEGGELVAWCMTASYGSVSMLFTKEAYRRQGLGAVVVRALAERQLAINWRPFCYIEDNNMPSHTLFESLGFKREGARGWLFGKSKHASSRST